MCVHGDWIVVDELVAGVSAVGLRYRVCRKCWRVEEVPDPWAREAERSTKGDSLA